MTAGALLELTRLVEDLKPELGGTPPVLVGTGISTLAYGWSTGDGGWILRVARDHPSPWAWRGGRVNEVPLARKLRQWGIPVAAEPTVVHAVDGRPTAILERWVQGTPLSGDRIRAEPELLNRLAAILDRLHAVDLDDAVVRHVPRDDSTDEFRQALAAAGLEKDLHQRASGAIAELDERAAIRTLCHRDVRLDHLIVGDDGEIVGLLDLGEVGVDDPAVDLALLRAELGPAAIAGICAAMDTADDRLAQAAGLVHRLRPLLELGPGGDSWGDPSTAGVRLRAGLTGDQER